ncbi:hypothetical protein NKH18_45240 [Streptomyces sp. M10(2022)]
MAEHLGLHVTYVHENGTIDTFGTAPHDYRDTVTLYERGGVYFAAVASGRHNPRGPLSRWPLESLPELPAPASDREPRQPARRAA